MARKLGEQKVVPQIFIEGSARRVVLDQRERSSQARLKCIEHHGLKCAVCGFNFREFYGEIGEGLIHVHHLKPIGQAVGEREVDPIQDLRPVCANCHYVIHGQKEPRTLGEMRDAVAQNGQFIRR